MPQLRPYQTTLKHDIYRAWQSVRNVLAVAPTGAGKTVIFSDIAREYAGASVVIAHRQELVSQTSLALARNSVRHRIIGAESLPRTCVQLHMQELGRSYYDPSAMCAAAGVDTLVRMKPSTWHAQIGIAIQDEAHHMLRENKWGKTAELFPNARWLGVTATPERADGKGLGRHVDGIFDTLVEAPTMRQLIRMGYLTDYRIFAPPSDIDISGVPVTASGEFSPEPLRKAVHKSHIVGDVVQHYLRLARGKIGITFAVDVESATEIAAAYRAAGVPAEVVSANTPSIVRNTILRRLSAREIWNVVNVDLFGEGFDLPAIEVVSFARPTHSFPLYAQQFGRALRLMVDPTLAARWDRFSDDERLQHIHDSTKPRAILIDHVNNVQRHGLPDSVRDHTLDRRDRRSRSTLGTIPVRTCAECGSCYEAISVACPFCGFRPIPAGRSLPEQVDGDLAELSPDALAALRGEIDRPLLIPQGVAEYVQKGVVNRYHERQEARGQLIDTMNRWGGIWTYGNGDTISEAQRRFFFRFGIDVATAQTLPRAEAIELMARIERDMNQ